MVKNLLKILLILSLIINGVLGFSLAKTYQRNQESISKSSSSAVTSLRTVSSDRVFKLVNDFRLSKNLSPITLNERLCKLADTRLAEIKHQEMSHEGLHYLSLQSGETLGENISQGYLTSEDTVDGWIKSTEHNKIMSTADFISGCVKVDETHTVLLMSNLSY